MPHKLLRATPEQLKQLEKRLRKQGLLGDGLLASEQSLNNAFYQTLSTIGIGDLRQPGFRAAKPNYNELGMDRVAGPPTEEDKEKYARVTNGGVLDENALVVQMILDDNDLLPDRYAVCTYNFLLSLYDRYLGRANDFNHSFDQKDAVCRIFDLHIGNDPGTALHPHRPTSKLEQATAFGGVYTALFATVAFPGNKDSQLDIQKDVLSGLIKDVSLACQLAADSNSCSVCMKPMERFWFWSYCDDHGFPGGQTEEGEYVCEIWNEASDAFVFGYVTDGAARRAGIVLNPNINS